MLPKTAEIFLNVYSQLSKTRFSHKVFHELPRRRKAEGKNTLQILLLRDGQEVECLHFQLPCAHPSYTGLTSTYYHTSIKDNKAEEQRLTGHQEPWKFSSPKASRALLYYCPGSHQGVFWRWTKGKIVVVNLKSCQK